MEDKHPSSETVPVVGHVEKRINRYYLKISRKYMSAGIFFMLSLIVYIMFVMAFFGKYVTYENLRYLVRDIGAVSLREGGSFEGIVYNAEGTLTGTSFRGGLALYSGDNYYYYDSSGTLLIEDSPGYSSPSMEASGKYLLLYDVGGNGYTVFNQLTSIITRTATGRIVAGDIADDGSMLLLTRSKETKYVAELYNSAFVKVMSIYKENYAVDAALSPDGKFAVIASAIPEETDITCEITICERGQSEPIFKTTYSHTMPLSLEACEGGFIMLCDNGIYFFDYSGGIKSSLGFGGMTLAYASMSEKTACVVGQVNALGNENRYIAFSSDGEILCDSVFDERVNGAYASLNTDDALMYLRTTDKLVKINSLGEYEEHTPEREMLSVVPTENGVLVCTPGSAYKAFEE